jgi:hypothetical protein
MTIYYYTIIILDIMAIEGKLYCIYNRYDAFCPEYGEPGC